MKAYPVSFSASSSPLGSPPTSPPFSPLYSPLYSSDNGASTSLETKIGWEESSQPLFARASRVPLLTRDGERLLAQQLDAARTQLYHCIFREVPEQAYAFLYSRQEKVDRKEVKIETVLSFQKVKTKKRKEYFAKVIQKYKTIETAMQKRPHLREQYIQRGIDLIPPLQPEELPGLVNYVNSDPTVTPQARAAVEPRVAEYHQLRSQFAEANLRLVMMVAGGYAGRGIPFLDLVQEGNVGLLKAIDRYDWRRGNRFNTFAIWWIRRNTWNCFGYERQIWLPVNKMGESRNIRKSRHSLEQQLQREPTRQEIAEYLGQPLRKIEELAVHARGLLSLEAPRGDDQDYTLHDQVEDTEIPLPSHYSTHRELEEAVEQALVQLPDREQIILRQRFGIGYGRVYTLQEVGDKYGVTRERIRQVEERALRKLRQPAQARLLNGFVE